MTKTVTCLENSIFRSYRLLLTRPPLKFASAHIGCNYSVALGSGRMELQLRSTMTQERLNYLMILHVHKTFTDIIIRTDVAKEFVNNKGERRLHFFLLFAFF